MREISKHLTDHDVLSEEELRKETTRLIGDIKEALRRSPEFQQASVNLFFDYVSESMSNDTHRNPDRPVSFERDGNKYEISRTPGPGNQSKQENIEVKRQTPEGTIVTVSVSNLNVSFWRGLYASDISFSRTHLGSREEKIKNTREAVERVHEFIRELNSPAPATS